MSDKLGFSLGRNRKTGRGRAAPPAESFAEAWSRSKNGPDGAEAESRQVRFFAAAGVMVVLSALILTHNLF
jgi:hypothetical protein